jgi:hypothetical protein
MHRVAKAAMEGHDTISARQRWEFGLVESGGIHLAKIPVESCVYFTFVFLESGNSLNF